MTPIALTPAARGKRAKRSQTAPGHRGSVRRTAAPAAPRRVSGPARPAPRSATATAAPARAPRTARAGIAVPRPARKQAPRQRTAPSLRPTLGARAVAFVRSLPDHQVLDRVVRGRAWIPILGVLLAGIVAMQVEVLKLGAGVGRSIERSTQLQSRNELLRASVATLADDQRIERLAVGMGMVMPSPTAINFLSLKPAGYVQRAASSIHQPDPTAFLATLPTTADTTGGGAVTAGTGTAGTGTAGAGTVGVATAPTDTSSATSSSSTNGG
jgi:hypothetical protein